VGGKVKGSELEDNDFIGTGDALIHYYLKTNPDDLTDDEWTTCYNRVVYCITKQNNVK